MSFSELGLVEPILRAVTSEGYTTPTPIQAQSIPHVIAGKDLLGCAQTGTGKTAAFALPILHRLIANGNPSSGSGRKIRVLVLAPTRELALQISESFASYGRNTSLRSTVIFGGVGQGNQVKALQRGVDILIATPGRLNDLMDQGYVNLQSLQVFVLDEADRMLDIGFLPDIRRVMAKIPKVRQTLFFSATMPSEVRTLADDLLTNPTRIEIAPVKATTDLIDQSVCMVQKPKKVKLLAGFLKTEGTNRSIVFARTKHGADRITRQLAQYGIRAEAIHGNKSQNARQRTLDRFRMGRLRVLVATDLAARGIDVDDITHVFNYDLPHEPETYVHRIGRTGRAGSTGKAIAFCDPGERSMLKGIERLLKKQIPLCQDIPEPPVMSPESEQVFDDLHSDSNSGSGDGVEIRRPFRDRNPFDDGNHSDSESGSGEQRNKRRRRRPTGSAAGEFTGERRRERDGNSGGSRQGNGRPAGPKRFGQSGGNGRPSRGGKPAFAGGRSWGGPNKRRGEFGGKRFEGQSTDGARSSDAKGDSSSDGSRASGDSQSTGPSHEGASRSDSNHRGTGHRHPSQNRSGQSRPGHNRDGHGSAPHGGSADGDAKHSTSGEGQSAQQRPGGLGGGNRGPKRFGGNKGNRRPRGRNRS